MKTTSDATGVGELVEGCKERGDLVVESAFTDEITKREKRSEPMTESLPDTKQHTPGTQMPPSLSRP